MYCFVKQSLDLSERARREGVGWWGAGAEKRGGRGAEVKSEQLSIDSWIVHILYILRW
jgi:hypothetical protein